MIVTSSASTRSACCRSMRCRQADSGHPGMPMGAATMAYVLWTRHLRHNPKNPAWPDRDRFVLSAGHASMLLYSLLFLTGYDLTMDDIEQFRQWKSRTPGHPERGCTPGVEVTTGPLGQGFGEQRRLGDRGAVAGGDVQSPRRRRRGPLHLRPRQRRRPDGRGRRGSGVARRHLAARSLDRAVRRQPDHALGDDERHVYGGCRRTLRSLWLARAADRRSGCGGRGCGAGRRARRSRIGRR